MNLESLRQRILSATTTFTSGETSWRLAKMGAADGLHVNALLSGMALEGDGEEKTVKRPEDLVRLYAAVISKSVVDEQGIKTLDSDEGRGLLERLPRDEFMALGERALEWNLGDSKKNSPTTSVSPTSSASPLEASTPTPITS